jgi:hypothetical protein
MRSFKTRLGHRFISLQAGPHQHSEAHSHQSIVAYALPVRGVHPQNFLLQLPAVLSQGIVTGRCLTEGFR